jgi:uncharacterized membrane protein
MGAHNRRFHYPEIAGIPALAVMLGFLAFAGALIAVIVPFAVLTAALAFASTLAFVSAITVLWLREDRRFLSLLLEHKRDQSASLDYGWSRY